MSRRVFALTYLSANRALYSAALMYAVMLRQKGLEVDIVDLGQPDAAAKFDRDLRAENVDFCFAPQGVGGRLGENGQSLWKQRRIPFVAVHGDNPCYNIFNHFSDSAYAANLYCYPSFAEIHRRYIGTGQVVETMPYQISDPGPSAIMFRERPIKFLFLKSGESVAECVRHLDTLPQPLRDGVWRQLARAARSPDFLICDLVQEVFSQSGIDRAANFDLFWGCAHWMDMYLRRKRAVDLVEWLKFQEDAVIVGNGWDFIDRTGARACFKQGLDIGDVLELYRQSRFIFNTTPYGSDIVHERVPIGLFNQSIVVSDLNAWANANCAHIPAFKGFDWGRPLDDQLQGVIGLGAADAEAQAQTGRVPAQALFTGFDVAGKILSCVEQIRAKTG